MFYRYSLTVPAGTPQDNPIRQAVRLDHGIIHQVEVSFPPGCAGLVHVSIWRWESQLWPSNTGESFAWDDYTLRFTQEAYGLTARPYTLKLQGWSEDLSYDHTVIFRFALKKPELHRPGSWVGRLLRGQWGG